MTKKKHVPPIAKPKRTHPWRTQYGNTTDEQRSEEKRREQVIPYHARMGLRK